MENQLKGLGTKRYDVQNHRDGMRRPLTGPRGQSLSPECLENSSEQSGHDACAQLN